jgi:integrase
MRLGGSLKSFWLGSAIGPAAITLTAARQARARAWLDNRGKGAPKASGKPFSEALDAWLDANAASADPWAAKSLQARRALSRISSLAALDVAKITQADVLAALADQTPRMHAEKRGWLADLFSFCKVQQWRTGDNPARFDADTLRGFAGVKKGEGHAAVNPADLAAVYAALPNTVAGNALRFQILTAARPGEVVRATWSQIVGENGSSAWVRPVEIMKLKKAHRVPLTCEALALLGERGADDALVFAIPGRVWESRRNALNIALKKVAPGMTAHGTARAAFKTWASEAGKDRELTERSLAHDFGTKVENAYQRSDLFDRRRELMAEWASFASGH